MEKTNVGKLSFWKKFTLLRQLIEDPSSIPPYYQAALLNAVSTKTFRKYYSEFCRFNPETFDVLLEPRNHGKFSVCKHREFYPFELANEFAQKGTDEQVLDVLEEHCSSLGHILLERHSELFERYVRRHGSIPLNLWKEIIKQKREDLVLMFLKFRDQDYVLSAQYIDVLFDSSLEKGIKTYLEQNSVFELSKVRLYILKSGDVALCKKMLENNPLIFEDEFLELFKLNQPELILTLVKRMIQDEFADDYTEIPAGFENSLIHSNATEAIMLYMQKNELDYGATICLFETGNEELIRFYLESDRFKECKKFPVDVAAMFLFSGNNASLQCCYKSKFGLPYQLERKLILSENDKLNAFFKDKYATYMQDNLINYIDTNELYPLNAALLMEKGPIDDAIDYFQKYPLPDIAVVALFKNGKDNLRKAYLNFLLENHAIVCEAAEKYFVKFAPQKKLMTYLQNNAQFPLKSVDGEIALLKREDAELCHFYVEKFGFKTQALVSFIQCGSVDFIKSIFKNYLLPDEVLSALIDSGRNSLMIKFFKESDLDKELELKLIHSDFSKNERAVCFYLDKYDLFADNEVELIKLNNNKMIDIYLAKHSLSQKAEELYASMY